MFENHPMSHLNSRILAFLPIFMPERSSTRFYISLFFSAAEVILLIFQITSCTFLRYFIVCKSRYELTKLAGESNRNDYGLLSSFWVLHISPHSLFANYPGLCCPSHILEIVEIHSLSSTVSYLWCVWSLKKRIYQWL